jgi:hypothetical protein
MARGALGKIPARMARGKRPARMARGKRGALQRYPCFAQRYYDLCQCVDFLKVPYFADSFIFGGIF